MTTLTATVTTKATKTGFFYTVTLSDGTVATRASTKAKAAILLRATGTVQTGFTTTLSSKPATLVAKACQFGAPYVVVELATGRVLVQGSTSTSAPEAAPAADPAPARSAAQAAAWTKFLGAPARLARQMDRDVAFWGADHPDAPAWGALAVASISLTEAELADLFTDGCRTSGDLCRVLERRLGVRA